MDFRPVGRADRAAAWAAAAGLRFFCAGRPGLVRTDGAAIWTLLAAGAGAALLAVHLPAVGRPGAMPGLAGRGPGGLGLRSLAGGAPRRGDGSGRPESGD